MKPISSIEKGRDSPEMPGISQPRNFSDIRRCSLLLGDLPRFRRLTHYLRGLPLACEDLFFGQYSRMNRLKLSFGAGSQFDSRSLPGDSFCRYRLNEPSLLKFNLSRSPIA